MTWEWVLVIGEVLIFVCIITALHMSHETDRAKWEYEKKTRERRETERRKQLRESNDT